MPYCNRAPGLRTALMAGALLFAVPAAADHHVKLRWSGDLGLGYDDNVGNAAQDEDRRDSAFVSAGLNLDQARRLGSTTGLLLRGSLRAEAYEATQALSNGKLTALARLAHRPEGGFHVPTLAGWVSASLWEFDSAMRDGTEIRVGAYVAEPLTTALSARVSAQASERRAASEVFDLSSWSAGLSLDWSVLGALTLYAGYQFHDGELVSSGSGYGGYAPEPGDDSYAASWDDALDGQTAYRVQARTQVGSAGLNVPVSANLSLDAQVQQVESEASGGIGYSRSIAVVSALARF